MLSVGGERQSPRPVATCRQIEQFLRVPGALGGFRIIGKPEHFIRRAHVNVPSAKRDTKRPIQPPNKLFTLLRSTSVLRIAQYINFPRTGVRNKNVAIRRGG